MDTRTPAPDREPVPPATSLVTSPNGTNPASALTHQTPPRCDADRKHPSSPSGENRADRAEAALDRLRRQIRDQLAGAVTEQRLDVETANGMLEVFGLAELPRRWTVRIGLTFVCEVTAGTAAEAFDTAEDTIAAAVTDAACPIDVDWDSREQVYANPGDIDHDRLRDSDPGQPTAATT